MNEWISLLQTFGLAATIIFFVGVCIWKAGGWAGENVVKPIVAKYIQLLDSLIVSITKQGDTLVKVGTVLEKLGGTLDNMGSHAIHSMEMLNNISTSVTELKHVKNSCNNTIAHLDKITDEMKHRQTKS